MQYMSSGRLKMPIFCGVCIGIGHSRQPTILEVIILCTPISGIESGVPATPHDAKVAQDGTQL